MADGNSDLEPALEMCNDLKRDIDEFAKEAAAPSKDHELILALLRRLLDKVDDTIPSLHLALRSIEGGGRHVPSSSQLLQASSIVQAAKLPTTGYKVIFCLRMYSLFAANVRSETAPFTWKEEFYKCQLTLRHKAAFQYELEIQEDINDGRYHEEKEGRKMTIDVHNVKRMYYTQSGALLHIEDSKAPVLVLKVQKNKAPVSTEHEHEQIKVKQENPDIAVDELRDADWYAFETWTDGIESEEDEEEEGDDEQEETKDSAKAKETKERSPKPEPVDPEVAFEFKTSLLLLESVIKLSTLEVSERINHLNASDDLLHLYMS